MKRPPGVIGLTHLLFLAVAFYFRGDAFTIIMCVLCALVTAFGAALRIFGKKPGNYMIAVGLSGLAAMLSMFLFQNYHMQPIINDYSDKEITVTGYISDEIRLGKYYDEYPLTTETINGETGKIKIDLWLSRETEIREFDRVRLRLTAREIGAGKGETIGVYLRADDSEIYEITPEGSRVNSLYSLAVRVRMRMKRALDEYLSREAAGICKAVLFGDKDSLSRSELIDFNRNGTTFLIVVSGLHLSVVSAALLALINRIKIKRITAAAAIPIIWGFTAIAGFPFSVLRAAIMATILNLGILICRDSDPVNSLGISALLITAINPCAAGSTGLLLSFSSLLGILLWSGAISRFVREKLHLNSLAYDPNAVKGMRLTQRLRYLPGRIAFKLSGFIISLLSASLSASIFAMPIIALLLGSISPLSFVTAFLTEPAAALILLLALAASVTGCFPFLGFITVPLCRAAELLCSWLKGINHIFSRLPLSSVKAEKPFIIITLALGAALIVAGLAVSRKKKLFRVFLPAAVALTAFVLCAGWALELLFFPEEPSLIIHQNGEGISVTASAEGSLSLLSFSGSAGKAEERISELWSSASDVDCLVVPRIKSSRSFLTALFEETEVYRAYIAENVDKACVEGAREVITPAEGEVRRVRLNDSITDELIVSGGVIFQYIRISGKTVLFLPYYADIKRLPEEYRAADVILTESLPKNSDLLSSGSLIFASNSEIKYQKCRKNLEKISGDIRFIKNAECVIK